MMSAGIANRLQLLPSNLWQRAVSYLIQPTLFQFALPRELHSWPEFTLTSLVFRLIYKSNFDTLLVLNQFIREVLDWIYQKDSHWTLRSCQSTSKMQDTQPTGLESGTSGSAQRHTLLWREGLTPLMGFMLDQRKTFKMMRRKQEVLKRSFWGQKRKGFVIK